MTRMNPELLQQLAPTGVLRASINFGNPVLANRDAQGQPCGVSVDLARALAQELGVPLAPVLFDSAGHSVAAVARGEADIGFFALDPERAAQLRFAPAYVLIEGAYLVRSESPMQAQEEVDRSGVRVMVGRGSAYDLYLSRELRAAQVVRADTSPSVVDEFLRLGLDVAAGVRQQLEADRHRLPDLRLLSGNFMVIEQAVGIPHDRSHAALQAVWEFVEQSKASGFVADSLARAGIRGVTVAPPAGKFREGGALSVRA